MEPTPCEKPSLSDCKRNFYHAQKKWAIWGPCALSSDLRNKETFKPGSFRRVKMHCFWSHSGTIDWIHLGLTLEATVVKKEQLTYMVNKQTIQLLYSANKIYLLAHELDKIGK